VSRGPRRAATSRSGNGQGGKVLGGLLLVGLAIGGGCGRQIPVHPVSGRVTLDGKPLVDAQISFRPANGPEAFGVLDGDGRYTLSTRAAGDGAVAGKHAVTLSPLTEGLILTPDADPRGNARARQVSAGRDERPRSDGRAGRERVRLRSHGPLTALDGHCCRNP
jgi:hypothetical protein